jgi:glycosyltransferase involved in cell wall biosynthesis
MQKTNKTLLVIPEYNDTKRLTPFLMELCACVTNQWTVQIVDDGSTTDNIISLHDLIANVKSLNPSIDLPSPLIHNQNKGKGSAIRTGWSNRIPCHDILGFVDADGSISPQEVIRLENTIRNNKYLDGLWGSRIPMLGRKITRAKYKKLPSKIFQIIIRRMTKLPIFDSQCGVKFIRRAAYEIIEPSLNSQQYCLDLELTMAMLKYGKKIEEIPIDWEDKSGSKVSMLKDSIKMIQEARAICSHYSKQ